MAILILSTLIIIGSLINFALQVYLVIGWLKIRQSKRRAELHNLALTR